MKETLFRSPNRGSYSHLYNGKSPKAIEGVTEAVEVVPVQQIVITIIKFNKVRIYTSSLS